MKEDVITLIKDAMNQILLERPEEPLVFLQKVTIISYTFRRETHVN